LFRISILGFRISRLSIPTSETPVDQKRAIMQNKANLLNAKMNVTSFYTVDYENKSNWKLGENKANTNPTCRGVASGEAGLPPSPPTPFGKKSSPHGLMFRLPYLWAGSFGSAFFAGQFLLTIRYCLNRLRSYCLLKLTIGQFERRS